MQTKKLFQKSLLATAITLTALQVNAAGFQLNAQSATGLGRAFAGDAVIADNASVMARNPAAMALFDKTALSVGFDVIDTSIEVSNAFYSAPANPLYDGDTSNYDNAGDTSIAPNLHVIVPLNEQFAVGFNLYTNFGTKTEFDDSFTGSEYGGLTDLKTVNFGLSGSYRINPQWSVGAGLDIIYGSGKLERTTSAALGSQQVLNVDADGIGFGFNLGTVFELNDNNRFGLSYRYSPEIEADGDISTTSPLGVTEYDTLYVPLPDMIEFSGYHRIEDTKYAVHYSVQWIGWSAFDTLDADSTTLNNYQWKDAMHFAIGGTYYLNNDWTLRTGYMYDQSAQDEVTSISVPDSDRQWFSAGFTYHLAEHNNVDFGFTYLLGEDIEVYEDKGISNIAGTTRADAILVGVQYSHSF